MKCAACNRPIPDGKRADARYCSKSCQEQTKQARNYRKGREIVERARRAVHQDPNVP